MRPKNSGNSLEYYYFITNEYFQKLKNEFAEEIQVPKVSRKDFLIANLAERKKEMELFEKELAEIQAAEDQTKRIEKEKKEKTKNLVRAVRLTNDNRSIYNFANHIHPSMSVGCEFLNPRGSSEFEDKGFYLQEYGEKCDWKIVKDTEGCWVLVPNV